MNRIISIIILLIILYGQCYAQWEETNFPSAQKVNALVISDSNIFAGTNGDGIFVSTNNGESWVSINDGLQSKVVYTVFINGTTIFAGTETGASVSTDYGLNWSTINSGLSGKGVWSFAAINSTIFAGTWSGVYTTNNNGINWEASGLSNTEMPVHSIIVYDQFIFAATFAGGVFSSQSNGHEWDDIGIKDSDKDTGISFLIPVYSLVVIDSNVIAGAEEHIYYKVYNDLSAFMEAATFNAHLKSVLCLGIRNGNLFAGNSNGFISLSRDSGLSWNDIKPSLTHLSIYSLALNKSYIFAGTGNGVWRLWYPESVTNVDNDKEAPSGFALEQNYPNPFNPVTTIKYSVLPVVDAKFASTTIVQLKVYDILGREVATLVNEEKPAGRYEVTWNAAELPSGMYFYQLMAGSPESNSGQVFTAIKKLMLLK